ncbi:Membrane protein implicated in regulation of membrane protease activity [Lachnospiraceae bacterium XBB1006]|nr:Membrane protein implicated in regulation of membrane protease activity [Lachnospiraceae bacterium XBB1006]
MDFFRIAWLVILVVMLVVELATLGLTTIWFAGGAVVALVANLVGLSPIIQVVLFVVVSILLLALTRPMAVRHLNQNRTRTNAESLIGRTGFVLEEINNLKATGCVSVDGQEWTARNAVDGEIIAKDQVVTIEGIQGVKLIVMKKEKE